jgi:hypothetical protein
MENSNEQWQGDWMRDSKTGQLIDEPVLNRYEMFMLIRQLRAAVHSHAQTISNKEAVIEKALEKVADLEDRLAMSEGQRAEWTAQANQLTVANDEKAGEIQRLRNALLDFSRQNCDVGLRTMRIKYKDLLGAAILAGIFFGNKPLGAKP